MDTIPTLHQRTRRQVIFTSLAGTFVPVSLLCSAQGQADVNTQTSQKLIAAARLQIGQTIIYDGSYVSLDYPNGDIDVERGVCTDVIIRAYRRAFNFDLQKAVHEDMRHNFPAYPTIWGAKKPDRHIDHRRVPNLQTFFKRHSAALPTGNNAQDYLPGDIVTQMLPKNLPHIVIVSDQKTSLLKTPLVIHNIGAGAKEEDTLFSCKITGHYRFYPETSNL